MNNLTNTSFLLSRPYWLGIYAEIIDRLGTGNNLDRENTSDNIQATVNPYEIAYLQKKEVGVIKLVCLELIQMGFIQVRDSQLEVVTYFSNTSHLEPIEQTIFDFLHTPQTVKALLKDKEVQKAIGDRCKTYRQSLINQGYIKADNKKYLAAGMSGLLILGLVGKPIVGMLAGYRYLLLLIGAAMPKASLAIAATAWLGKKSQSSNHLTAKGKEYLLSLKKNVINAPDLLSPPVKPNYETSLLFALHGLELIGNTKIEAYEDLFNLFSTG